MNICDTGPFFQKSFLKVIDPGEWNEPVCTAEEYAMVLEGKARRASAVLDDSMLRYNALENQILGRVLHELNTGFQSLGIHLKPSQWYGPGQAAQAWLKGRAITAEELAACTPAPALEAARESYYGGWFEITAHGLIPGTTYEYDINSAYPHIIRSLPCLEHGEWKHNDFMDSPRTVNHRNTVLPVSRASHSVEATLDASSAYTLVHARVSGRNRYLGSMLHRDERGNISRPHDTEGWYWLAELRAAENAGLVRDFRVSESWTYHPCDCPAPLREVESIYRRRLDVGKKTPTGMACKLVANSLYGKFAQSIGKPKYGNSVYASLTTSGTRTLILDAIATHPKGAEDVLMVATDGVYFKSPHPGLTVGTALGAWEAGTKEDITLFKPGVYWDKSTRDLIDAGSAPVFKARGVNARDFGKHLADVDQQFLAMRASTLPEFTGIQWPSVTFPVEFSMVSAVQALARGKWETAGTLVVEPTATQTSDPWLKRCHYRWEDGILRSEPVRNEPFEPSHPYEKRFGMEDPWSQENAEASGVMPDGLPGDLWKEVLYG